MQQSDNYETEPKLTAPDAEETGQLIENILESISDGFYALDTDWRFVYVNRKSELLTNRSREEVLGKSFWEIFPEAIGSTFEENYRRAVREQTQVAFEEFYPPLDSWFEIRAYPSAKGLSIYFHNITNRKRAEATLRETEERYRALIEATATTVWHATPEGALSFVGDVWTEISGQSVPEILKWGWLDAIHPDDRKRTVATWQNSLRDKSFYAAEFRVLTTNGIYKWFAASAVPVFGADGNLREWVGINVDIDGKRRAETELKQAAETVRESQEKLQTALKAGKMGSWELSLPTGELFSSDSCKINYGRALEEPFTYQDLADSILAADRAAWGETIDRAIAESTEFEIEYRVCWSDNSIHWVLVRGNCVRDETGKTNSLTGVSLDITERKQAEEKIRESEESFSALAESVPQLVWMAEADGFIFWYNRNWYDYTGMMLEQMKGWGWEKVHDPKMLPQVTERWEESLQSGEPFEMEFPLRGKDGNFRWFLTRVNPLRNAEGRIVRWCGTNTDIEELLQTRMRAERANQLKDEFLATLSHELRTPLNAILGWSQMLQNRNLSEAETKKALATIERNARSQSQLIDDILDVSRIITGKLRLDVRAVELPTVIMAAVDTARPAAEAKNIRLQTLLDPQAETLSGDPDRLQQVVWNLLSNAIKFTPKNGRVQVRLERVNSHVEIVVSDTGKGIEPDFLPHVFDRFRQSDGSMTRRHGGLGLGLAIVRQLVELHGGTVSVASDGAEQGSTFIVNLPLLPVRSEPASEIPRIHPKAEATAALDCPPVLSELRVLLVDDEADSRNLLNIVLGSCGANVTTASSAAEAFETVKQEEFDIIISDIGMPDEDGFSLIRKIRDLPDGDSRRIPAIALTAYARAEDRVLALRSGFQMHIAKPVEPAELIAVVENLAKRKKNSDG